jgi:hypothetical protein
MINVQRLRPGGDFFDKNQLNMAPTSNSVPTNEGKLTRQAVLLAATTLILAQGCTTVTLVKESLRERGFNVYRAEVAKRLFEVAQSEGWRLDDNGPVRIYYFPQIWASIH